MRISCMHASVSCSTCGGAFTMAELSSRLSEPDFSCIADAVGDRNSDRV